MIVGTVSDTLLVLIRHQCVPLPELEGDTTILPPPYIVRMLFIYGRSNGLIEFRNKEVSDKSLCSFILFIFMHQYKCGVYENCFVK